MTADGTTSLGLTRHSHGTATTLGGPGPTTHEHGQPRHSHKGPGRVAEPAPAPHVACPSCGKGDVEVMVQSHVTWRGGEQVEVEPPDLGDGFAGASCTEYDVCRTSLNPEIGDGRIRRAHLAIDGDPVEGVGDELIGRWIAAAYAAIGHEHPEWAVTFNDDGTMTCTECGQTAPGEHDVLTVTERCGDGRCGSPSCTRCNPDAIPED